MRSARDAVTTFASFRFPEPPDRTGKLGDLPAQGLVLRPGDGFGCAAARFGPSW